MQDESDPISPRSAPCGLRQAHGLSECGPENPVESTEKPSLRKEVVRAFEVGRIKRSADPALNSDTMPGENQCRIGVAALLDPAYSLKSRRLPLRTTNRQAHSLSDRLGLRGMTPSHGPVYRFDGLFRPRAVGGSLNIGPRARAAWRARGG